MIAGVIYEALSNHTFSLADFYLRRCFRLLPALYVVIFVSFLATLLASPPYVIKDSAQVGAAALLYFSNVVLLAKSGYFSSNSELQPLLHLWSLSVEEQFYLLFPIIVVALFFRIGRVGLLLVIVVLSFLSFSAFAASNAVEGGASFYLLQYRAWELLAGAGVRLLISRFHFSFLKSVYPQVVGFVGVLLFVINPLNLIVDATYMLCGVLTTALLLASVYTEDRLPWLSIRPVKLIGLWSYSIYLVHQPILAFYRGLSGSIHIPAFNSVVLLAGICACGFTLHRVVEHRYRYGFASIHSRVTLLAMTAIMGGVLAIVGKAGGDILIDQNTSGAKAYRIAKSELDTLKNDRCHLSERDPAVHPCEASEDTGGAILVLGDSHAAIYARVLRDRGVNVVQRTKNMCPPIFGFEVSEYPGCSDYREQSARLKTAARYDAVLIAARWNLYIDGGDLDNGLGGVDRRGGHRFLINGHEVNAADRHAALGSGLSDYTKAFSEVSDNVVVLTHSPEAGWSVPGKMLEKRWSSERSVEWPTMMNQDMSAAVEQTLLPHLEPSVSWFSPYDLVCRAADGCEYLLEDESPLLIDSNHPSTSTAGLVIDFLVEQGLIPVGDSKAAEK